MIKISKDLSYIPASLLDRKTEKRRNTCIKDDKYHQEKVFHQRYKQSDIKETLKIIYHEKCAFCEQIVIECKDNNLLDCSSTVEHYRPKSIYYWLAYSWDNLLYCCWKCNKSKDNNFETLNAKIEYDESFKDTIHSSNLDYQKLENPKMINPEIESILDKLSFYDGVIKSDDERAKYTIRTCALDRKVLNDKRVILIDDYIDILIDMKTKNQPLSAVLQELFSDFKNEKKEFRALRYWILKNYKSLIESQT